MELLNTSSSSSTDLLTRQAELEAAITAQGASLVLRQIRELLQLRLEHAKNKMIDDNSDILRGRAQELRSLLKILT